MPALSSTVKRSAQVAILALCFGVPGSAGTAEAQVSGPATRRTLARACWFGGNVRGCAAAVQGSWDWIATTLLSTVQSPSQSSRVVWDGTYSNPDAPSFYALKGVVAAVDRTSSNVCGRYLRAKTR